MGTREANKSRSRQRLLQAAYDLFSTQGYEETSVGEIAAAAGVSRSTLFNYFSSKAALIFTDGEQITDAALAKINSSSPGENPADVLAAAVGAMIDSTVGTSRDPDSVLEASRIRLIMTTPQLRAVFLERWLTTTHTIAGALREAHPALDEVTANTMVGAVLGGALAAGSANRGVPSRRVLTRSLDLLTDALRTTGQGVP